MKIGMIVAIAKEFEQVLLEHGSECETIHRNAFDVMKMNLNNHEIYITQSGAGEIGASAAAQFLISCYDVELIVNYGVVGALNPDLALAETVIVKEVIHTDFDTSEYDHCEKGRYVEFDSISIPTDKKYIQLAQSLYPDLKAVTCASADKFIEGENNKKSLRESWNCDICEMEAAGIVITSKRNNVPVMLIKAISDSATGGAIEFNQLVAKSSKLCMNVLFKILETI